MNLRAAQTRRRVDQPQTNTRLAPLVHHAEVKHNARQEPPLGDAEENADDQETGV